jgi:hypothetical protein
MEETSQYTVDEAAQILELSPACVRQMLRAGELEGERREERVEGVLGPWRIPEHAVHALREGDPDVLRAKRRAVCDTDATTVTLPPGEAPADVLSEASSEEISEDVPSVSEDVPSVSEDVPSVSEDLPSEASELLSESVRVVREKVEALREELGVLEGRLEVMEITESALREDLRREKERADREQERADQLHTELETERARRPQDLQESSGWLFKG